MSERKRRSSRTIKLSFTLLGLTVGIVGMMAGKILSFRLDSQGICASLFSCDTLSAAASCYRPDLVHGIQCQPSQGLGRSVRTCAKLSSHAPVASLARPTMHTRDTSLMGVLRPSIMASYSPYMQ